MTSLRLKQLALAAGLAFLPAVASSSTFITTLSGSDCAGVFGSPFDTCVIPTQYDPDQSPVIAKWDFDSSNWQVNGLFPSVTGNEFSITLNDAEGVRGSWTYTPGADDPLVTFFVVKAGNNFNLYSADGFNFGNWDTNDGTLGGHGASHITFYDTGTSSTSGTASTGAPEPASSGLALLGLGLLGASFWARRKS